MGTVIAAGAIVVFFFVLFVIIWMFPFGIYIRCMSAGVPANPMTLVAMKLRNVPPDLIVDSYIKGNKGGLELYLDRLEAHYLSGGNIALVVDALISAARAHINLTFERAAAIDLAGRDVYDAVRMSVEPRVISTGEISGIARNGVEVIAKAKITVRANLATMVGGAGEETILARVGEGIVSAIGSAETHLAILKKPELITQCIMEAGLDSNTAFEIVSIDIADIDVGRNIGAMLQNQQAEADKKVAQAKAEGRRALAIAQTQENKALEQEMKAKLVEAEMVVPTTLGTCFKQGRLLSDRKKGKKKDKTSGFGLGADHG
ncbi:MAG TPA: flotillin-like protein FloA [Candidatus Ozemobacteraceae bacterium]|mgnify:CR=1 FL=1|nr:flotillin-like protein FloA [Candidatus Ozemobacteraceae bacterium]